MDKENRKGKPGGPDRSPPEGGSPVPLWMPDTAGPCRVELETLEERLESGITGWADMDLGEPCMWFCACFVVHGP